MAGLVGVCALLHHIRNKASPYLKSLLNLFLSHLSESVAGIALHSHEQYCIIVLLPLKCVAMRIDIMLFFGFF